MSLAPYRRVLARRGVPSLLLVALLARIPITAAPVVLTLHVVLDLGRGYAAAGLLGSAFALGAATGAPLLGRLVDRTGLRPVLLVTTLAEVAFWAAAPHLGYGALLAASLAGGLLSIPVFSVTRQALAAALSEADRRPAFSLDSMAVELSFAVGPAAGIAALTASSATATLTGVAALVLASGAALFVLDPPVRPAAAPAAAAGASAASTASAAPGAAGTATAAAAAAAPPALARTRWLTRPVVALLVVTAAATVTVGGTDTALTAVMTSFGAVPHLGLVFAVWCLASLVGGFVVGAMCTRVPPLAVLLALAALCLPVALATSWPVLLVLIIPTGLFCAPLMSSTADALTGHAPLGARGAVLGTHSAALTVGNALGAPLAGWVVDAVGARAGFVGVGVAGLVLAAAAVAVSPPRHRPRRPRRPGAGRGADQRPVAADALVLAR